MIGFLLFLCINYMLFSKDTEEAWSKVKYFFFFAVSPVLFIQMATDGSKILKEFINGYISSCLFISFITLIYVHFDPSKRFFLLNNPITFSIPLATSCIFLLYHLLYSKLTILYRITCAALILGLIFLIIMSGTRQSLFSLIVAFAGFVYLQKGRSIPKIQKVFVWVGFGFFLLSLPDITTSLGAYDRFTTEILSPEAGISVRTMYWSRAFNDFLSSPLLGIGLGSFGEYVMVPGLGLVKESEHNFILEILAESGLIGFGLFCGYYFLCLRSGLRVLMEGIQKDKSLAILFLCTVVFTLSQSMFSGGLVSSGNVLWSASALTAIYRARVLSSTTGVVCEFTPDEQS